MESEGESAAHFVPGRFPNPTVMTSYILTAEVENETGQVEVKNVLSSASGVFYKFSIVIKKSICGLVVRAKVLVPTQEGQFVTTGREVAIKVCAKDVLQRVGGVSLENPILEIGAMQDFGQPNHPNLSTQYECCVDDKNIYSVLKFHAGVELFDHILNSGPLREDAARVMFQQLTLALYRLQQRSIAHRDVSLENIMYNAADHATVLIDFGLSVKLQTDANGDTVPVRNAACGKGYYLPPEVDWTGNHPRPVNPMLGDIWSAGMCLLYAILGFPPIERACNDDTRYTFLTTGRLAELVEHWEIDMSPECIDLVQMILRPEPSERPSLQQIWQHSWMQREGYVMPYADQLSPEEVRALIGYGGNGSANSNTSNSMNMHNSHSHSSSAATVFAATESHAACLPALQNPGANMNIDSLSGSASTDCSDRHHHRERDHTHQHDQEEDAMCVSDDDLGSGEERAGSHTDCTTRDCDGESSYRNSVDSHWSAANTPTTRSSTSSSVAAAAHATGQGAPSGHNSGHNYAAVTQAMAVAHHQQQQQQAPATSTTATFGSSSGGAVSNTSPYFTRSRANSQSPHIFQAPDPSSNGNGSTSAVGSPATPLSSTSGVSKVYNTRSMASKINSTNSAK
jgi:serine/threonine protein kinase